MNELILSGLYIYPIKSAGGVAVSGSAVEPRGLRHDRRWMVVHAQEQERGISRQITAREQPRMLQIQVTLETDGLQVTAPGMPPLKIPYKPQDKPCQVSVWTDEMTAVSVSAEAQGWFSAYLHCPAKLVYLPDTSERWQAGKPYRAPLSFVDGNPFHLISEESVADLNAHLSSPVGPGRFRPNLLVRGTAPYAEDYWRRITLGGVPFRVVESCDRCVMVNLSAESTVPSAQPLRTLTRLRQVGKKVPFGQHLILDGWQPDWHLRVGDRLEVLETADTPSPMY